jgi:formylglycine-generating enzyme required for sulfatase activity
MGALLAGVPELINPKTEHFSDCAACPDTVVISTGVFQMGPVAGDRPRPNEGPSMRIELKKRFAIAAREVTFAEWDACVADGGCAGHKAEDFGWGRGDQPVVDVSFEDAQNYAAWLSEKTGESYRLPSEAEWEYAARAGSAAPFSFGEELSSRNANYDGRFAYRGKKGRWIGRPTPASRYPANAIGLFDMHGNVWEWTADCWRANIAGLPADGRPRGGACANRVLKGGAFNTGGWRLRAAHRIGKPASAREMEIGFRVVRVIE